MNYRDFFTENLLVRRLPNSRCLELPAFMQTVVIGFKSP